MGVSDLGGNAPESLTAAKIGDNTEFCFWLFPAFLAEKPGGFPSPESGTGCMGSSLALPTAARGVLSKGLSLALPKVTPGGTNAQPLREAG